MPAYALTSEEMVASLLPSSPMATELKKRGINVYAMSELWGVVGRARSGKLLQGLVERPMFGMVMARLNRIAALEWEIEKESKVEDRLESRLKMWKGIADEYAVKKEAAVPGMPTTQSLEDIQAAALRRRFYVHMKQTLIDLKPNLSNFSTALIRWRKRIRETTDDKSQGGSKTSSQKLK